MVDRRGNNTPPLGLKVMRGVSPTRRHRVNSLSPLAIAMFVIVLIVSVGAAAIFLRDRHRARSRRLSRAEYSRKAGEEARAYDGETLLQQRERRIAAFHIIPLAAPQRLAFIDEWLSIQARFVEDPSGAVVRADVLLSDVMLARSYPVADYEQRYEDISGHDADVIAQYHTAHAIAQHHARGDTQIDDLRMAMVHYRTLFDDLVNEPDDFRPIIEYRAGRTE